MKKAGVPDTNGKPTADFVLGVKDCLEVLTGLRRNKLVLPTVQTLTFSSPPTQAELQAFNKYVNAWAGAFKIFVARFDD